MDPLSVTVSIIAILQLSVTVLGYLNDVKDASKDRVKCAFETSNLFSLLVNLRFRLEEGSSNDPWYNAVRALGVENGPLDQFKQALEELQTKMTRGGRLKKVADALAWKFSKEEVTSILARIERLKTLVQIAVQMDHFKLCQAIKDDTGFIRTHVPGIQSGIDELLLGQDLARHEKFMEWISPTDFAAQQCDFIARKQKGTGQWFLDAPEFTKWLNRPNETLFCPGIPGAGKTMLIAIAIDHLFNLEWSGTVGVAYVYCNYKAQVDQSAAGLLAAILKQLVQSRPSIAEPVRRLHEQHASRGTKPSLEEISGALQSVLANYSTVYVAVDALDEFLDQDGTWRQFLAKLRNLQGRADLRLLVTSRFIPDIEDEFSTALKLEVRANDEDVKRFVAGQIYRLPKCIRRDQTLQDMVQDKVAQAVDGMFLLARLYVDLLLDKRTKSVVQHTLETLSRGSGALGKAYDDAIERIKGQLPRDSVLATNVISWILHAQRPLTTKEICHALAVKPDDKEIDQDNILDIEDIVSVCAGLVTVDEESDIIRLAHYTTQEYFEQLQEEWDPRAQLMIASTCLTYLCFGTFKSGGCLTEKDFKSRLVQNPFLDYAARYWGLHTFTVQEEVCELACSFLRQSSSISCAVQVSTTNYIYVSEHYPKNVTGLHLTAQFGLLGLSEELLSRAGSDIVILVKSKNGYGETPLYWATTYGHDDVAKLLIDKGAEVNAQGGQYSNALQAASWEGHESIVKVLLDKGAEVNAQGGRYSNALEAASWGGHEEIVKVLLDKGAKVNAQSGGYGNALQAASAGGHEEIVKVLLDKGAKVNAQGGKYGNALYAASAEGHEEIAKVLLNKGAEVNPQGKKYGSPLYVASERGHEEIVKMLLDKGAEANVQRGGYGNALQAASAGGHEEIVKVLLDKGAKVNAQGGLFGNALQAASAGGHEGIVKMLLDKGAEVNAQGGHFGNALQAASRGGHIEIVRVLLDKGAKVNAQGGLFGNALQAASAGGHEGIVKMLLDKGAEVNAQGGHFGNALQAASWGGYKEIVKVLLDKGADVNAQGGHFGNALQAASWGSHTEIVRVLLDKGAKVNAQGGVFKNALQAASRGGDMEIVKLLRDRGAK